MLTEFGERCRDQRWCGLCGHGLMLARGGAKMKTRQHQQWRAFRATIRWKSAPDLEFAASDQSNQRRFPEIPTRGKRCSCLLDRLFQLVENGRIFKRRDILRNLFVLGD